LRDPLVSILVDLDTPVEPKNADGSLSQNPMRVPLGTRSVATGTFLRLTVGDGILDIPGGVRIAPANAEAVSASQFERDESQSAVSRALHLSSHSLASTSTQRTIEEAVQALAEHNRWKEIVELTDSTGSAPESAPPALVTARVQALMRTGRTAEARTLAILPAVSRSMQRKREPRALAELSELMARLGAWDAAVEALKAASFMKDAPDMTAQLRQLALRRQLANSVPSATTAHFLVHNTPDVAPTVTERIGELLEAELQRLSRTFQTTSFNPTRVNVVRWDDFSGKLTGSENIVGFYDGDITIPFGSVSSFRESTVAILTHELTHAIVAQASSDNAPRWFQEGVARRMELVEHQENIFHRSSGQLFPAITLLDATLQGSIDPQAVDQAYVIAATLIRFFEDRYGADSVNRMIASFRGGADSDETLMTVTGKTFAELDVEFRAWGLTHSDVFIDRSPWPYMKFYSLGIDPRIQLNIHFSRPHP
jgi:hypothetical protein